jgi:hypothetical protein
MTARAGLGSIVTPLSHALVVLLLPGRHSEPQFNLGSAAGGIDRFPQIRGQSVVDQIVRLTLAIDSRRE